MKSQVFAATMRTSFKENMLGKLGRLMGRLNMGEGIRARDLVAVKLHFGEPGNTAFIRPIYLRRVVDELKALKAKPFLTDANTLYVGGRANSVDHLNSAIGNGFAYAVAGAPLIIADGLKGHSYKEVEINLKRIQTAYIGADVVEADALVSVAHFKLHELAGFGGAIKNVGMGSAARRGKLAQHSELNPKVKTKKCIGCGDCVLRCAHAAIQLTKNEEGEKKARINPEKCVGCGDCILVCRQGAVLVPFERTIPEFMEKMVEYTAAVLKGKEGKAFYLNFMTQISPGCDCLPHADAPLIRDMGILASRDIVAIDQACADILTQEPALPGNCLKSHRGAGEDKVRGVYEDIDSAHQLEYAEKIGLGSRDYELIWLEEKE